MKRILVLLVAVCCLLVACEKEGGSGSSIEGTTWRYWTFKLVFQDGYVYSYHLDTHHDTQTYKVKGDKVIFGDFLDHNGIKDYGTYDKTATLNSDKTRLTLRNGQIKDGVFIEFDDSKDPGSPMIFDRVLD